MFVVRLFYRVLSRHRSADRSGLGMLGQSKAVTHKAGKNVPPIDVIVQADKCTSESTPFYAKRVYRKTNFIADSSRLLALQSPENPYP
jgi:hypothetical protein